MLVWGAGGFRMSDAKEELTWERRKQIFQEELEKLWKNRVIPKSEYIRIRRIYDRTIEQELIRAELKRENISAAVSENRESKENEEIDAMPIKAISTDRDLLKENSHSVDLPPMEPRPADIPAIPVRPQKPEKTPEQIRERNLSAVLLTGVVLLLLGGLVLATSSWGSLNAVWKVLLIGLVAVFFAGMSYVADRLKIKQTSFAFLVLSSLFLPITILTASYYHIFGEYLSLSGSGRGLLGFLGGLVCLAVYVKIAGHFQSKVFIFISIVAFAATVYFGLAYVTPSVDWMFLSVALFDILLIMNAEQLKKQDRLELFKPFILQFLQVKVIAECLVVFILFSGSLIYSLSLMLLAFSFFFFARSFHKRYYEWVFSALFTYGYVHFVLHSALKDYSGVAYTLLPLLFSVLSIYLEKVKDQRLSKNFLYGTLAQSVVVFLYIQSKLGEVAYAQLFLAHIIIGGGLFWLTFRTGKEVFSYPAAVLFNLALLYLSLAFSIEGTSLLQVMFILQVIEFTVFYVFNRSREYRIFRQSFLFVPACIMAVIITREIGRDDWLASGIDFVLVSLLLLLSYFKDASKQLNNAAVYGFPIFLIGGLLSLYPFGADESFWSLSLGSGSVYVTGVSLVAIVTGFAAKQLIPACFPIFFLAGQTLSFLSFLLVPFSSLGSGLTVILMAVIVGINAWSVYLNRYHLFWLPVIATSFGFYTSLYDVFHFDSLTLRIAFFLTGPLSFFLIGEGIGRFAGKGRRYFFYFSHLLNLAAIPTGYVLIVNHDCTPFLYVGQLLLYVISVWRGNGKWGRAVFTYLGFSVLFLQVMLFFNGVTQEDYVVSLCLMITSGVIGILWAASGKEWRSVIEWYFVPFLHVAAGMALLETALHGFPASQEFIWSGLVTAELAFGLYLLMRRSGWENYSAIILGMAFLFYSLYAQALPLTGGIIILLAAAAVMVGLSRLLFKGIIKQGMNGPVVDFYRIFGFLYLLRLNADTRMTGEGEASIEIAGALLIPVYFALMHKFTLKGRERTFYLAVVALTTLYPYWETISHLEIPMVFKTEAYVMPLFIVSSLLWRKIYNRGKETQYMEMGITFLLFFILIRDAMNGGTLNDALIMGTISLASLLLGFLLKYKSYFLAGVGAILLNLYMNTNSMWDELPWWLYLIIGGGLLIAAASFFEWKKQKENWTAKEIMAKNKKRLKEWFNRWD